MRRCEGRNRFGCYHCEIKLLENYFLSIHPLCLCEEEGSGLSALFKM